MLRLRSARLPPLYWRRVHTSSNIADDFTYCMTQLRKYDYPNYLCTLHLKGRARAAMLALHALNVETALVGEQVKEPTVALMRMLWWQERVDDVFKGRPVRHPVLQALSAVVSQVRLSKLWVDRILEARTYDLQRETAPPDLAALEAYGESTFSPLLYLGLQASGVQDLTADHAASHTGKAASLALLLRATGHHSVHRRTYLPLDLTTKHGVRVEELYAGRIPDGLPDVVLEVASAARSHIEKARSLKSSLPPAALPLLLHTIPASIYLENLEHHNFDVLHPALQLGVGGTSHLWMHMKMTWHAARGSF